MNLFSHCLVLVPVLVHGLSIPRSNSNSSVSAYGLPQYAGSQTAQRLRAAAVAKRHGGFLYGPGTGGGPFSPIGQLGKALVDQDSQITMESLNAQYAIINNDQNKTLSHVSQYDGLKTVEDYTKLYGDNWADDAAPTNIAPGVLANYTSDLLFSMQRLSFSPFLLKRLQPKVDTLPFELDGTISQKVTTLPAQELLSLGRLFYADYRFLQHYAHNNNSMYSGNCDALFYMHPLSNDFLPLAIRTNTKNASLIYTPLDEANDWLLAKIMFNVDDFITEAFHHLANTHYVTEIVYEAALRTLSEDHPILPLLARAMQGAFGIRPLAVATLFSPGTAVETFTPYNGRAIENLTSDMYFHGDAGPYASNYFRTNLERRGLLNSTYGPELKHFPFFEDASPIHSAELRFVREFVNSYYTKEDDIKQDCELQAWLKEANEQAHAIDFPTTTTLNSREALAQMLTHFFHLTTSAHHAVNLNQVLTASTVLPFNPTALFKPAPRSKGVENVAEYLPPFETAVGIIELGASFARPLLANGNRTAVHLFDDEATLKRMNGATRAANERFKDEMRARAKVVRDRTFDSRGLSQGMPFIWQALNPEVMLYSTTI